MQVDHNSFLLAGNVHSRRAVMRATSTEAAGKVVNPRVVTSLRRALAFMRPEVLDFSVWRLLRRSERAWPAAAVAEVMAVIVQRYAGWPVDYCGYRHVVPVDIEKCGERARVSRQAQGTAIFQTTDAQIGLAAGQAGFTIVQALVDGVEGPDLRRAVRTALRGFLKTTLPATPSAHSMLLARVAEERGIPWRVVGPSRYVRIGLGRYARILKGAESTLISAIGARIAKDKGIANRMLADAGLPVPRQRTARTEEEAMAAGEELGYPLVVKPIDGNMGRDVTIGVSNKAEMRKAFAQAVSHSDRAVIETLIQGDEVRLLVAGGKFLAAMNRQPAQVTGDGTRSVAELVRKENRRPERDASLKGAPSLMKPISLDEDALVLLAKQGLRMDSVPAAGRQVFLRRESNLSRGGSPLDVTDQLHPSIRRVAEAAARRLRLDVCGVDFITTDLTRPWQETGGAICEVNSRPGVYSQIMSAARERRGMILESTFDALMGGGDYDGMPVVALVGAPEATRNLRQDLEMLAQQAGRKLGIVGEAATGVAPSSRSLQAVADLFHANDIDAALIVLTPPELLEQGLGLPRIAAAVIPRNLGRRALAVRHTLERVAGDAVLTADDPAATGRAAAALELPSGPPAGRPASKERLAARGGTYTSTIKIPSRFDAIRL
jgi:cyanophycin synthetase